MAASSLYRDVVQAATDFGRLRLWERMSPKHCLAVRKAGKSEAMMATVMGGRDGAYGLTLLRGPRACRCLRTLLDPAGPGDDEMEEIDLLGFVMQPYRDLPPTAKATIREAGPRPASTEMVPEFVVKKPHRLQQAAGEDDLHTLLLALRAIIEADRRGKLAAGEATADTILTLTISDDPASALASVGWERQEEPPVAPVLRFPAGGADLAGLPRLPMTWLVGLPSMGASIANDPRSIRLMLVVEEASELMLRAEAIPGGEIEQAVEVLLSTCRGGGSGKGGLRGLPRRMRFSSRSLYEAASPLLEAAGVSCRYEPTIPLLQHILQDFLEYQGEPSEDEVEAAEDEEDAAPFPPDAVPAAGDLEGWKQADSRLCRRITARVRSEPRLKSARAVKRYFDDDDLDYYVAEHRDRGVLHAYATWVVVGYRPTRKSRTEAERMLEAGMPAAEAALLRARIDAYPSIYRVAGHDARAGTVDLEDVLLGGRVTVHDRLFSQNTEGVAFITARLFAAGRYRFVDIAGPPMSSAMGTEAAGELQYWRVEFTADGLRRDAHKFGWLWRWTEEWHDRWRSPRLCNTDGHDLLFHTASFTLSDPRQVREALLARDDLEWDEDNQEFIWIRYGPCAIGDNVHLGRIELLGEELVLTVNSSERFAQGRCWLEALPGVRLKAVKTQSVEQMKAERPPDAALASAEPVPMTPELTASLQESMDQHYQSWLDMPLPVLGGQTPRQACRTEAGRQRVAMLIRTMADPTGPAPLHVPRAAMLRALGLAGGPEEPEAHAPIAPAPGRASTRMPPNRKVGPNEPCPCGSGRKFKKCCGRR